MSSGNLAPVFKRTGIISSLWSTAISAILGPELIQAFETFIYFFGYSCLKVRIFTITVRKLLSLGLYKVPTLVCNCENLVSINLPSFYSSLTHTQREDMTASPTHTL